MPAFNTDIYTKQVAANYSAPANGGSTTGVLNYLISTYTVVGTEVAADTINIGRLPIGAIVVPWESVISNDAAGGTGFTIATLGDSTSAARYSATAVAITAAGSVRVTTTNGQAVAPYAVQYITAPGSTTTDTRTIVGTIAASSGSMTAGKKITFFIAYLQAQ